MKTGMVLGAVLLCGCTSPERIVISESVPAPIHRSELDAQFKFLRARKDPISITANRERTLYLRADRDQDLVTMIRVVNEGRANIEQTIPVGHEPISIVLSHDESHAYVSNLGDGTISVLDVSGNGGVKNVQTIKVASNLFCLIFSRTGEYLYVVSRLGDKVWVIDPEVNRVIDTTTIALMDLSVKREQCYSGCHKQDPVRRRIFDQMSRERIARND